ncbi:hypothetical protein AB6A40_003050 [Gnathostoma spinigerum]|uniref:GTF3C1 extended winged-helix domain-containing protein n=1 Tax=Gnathostoma spinigerum TaxID=75299 RepID=A0ABD6E9N7_9BILA
MGKRRSKSASNKNNGSSDCEEVSSSKKKMKAEQSPEEMDDGEENQETSVNAQRSPYLQYDRQYWSPLLLYRTMGDLTASAIRKAGSEGVGRIEIGKSLGIDTTVKAGNRKVSNYIVNVMKAYPAHFGQYQKMEGKFRCIKYFWKVASQPKSFDTLFAKWNAVVGSSCPFSMGQVIKFPTTNLSTLRISDVSLRRLTDIMRILEKQRVVVTMNRFIKYITDLEAGYGYSYQIDKKSVLKCLRALEQHSLVKVFDTTVVEDSVVNRIQIICHREINSSSDECVETAIRMTIDEFHEAGRVFPHGQLRFSRKKAEELADYTQLDNELEAKRADIPNVWEGGDMTVASRLATFRLQTTRRASIFQWEDSPLKPKEKPPKIVKKGKEVEGDEERQKSEAATESRINSLESVADDPKPGNSVLEDNANACPEFIKRKYDPNISYGYQNKMIRCFVVHELVYHFVYGLGEEVKPNVYERFPPGEYSVNQEGTPIEKIPVYVNQESPLRFVPPLPTYSGLPRGWVMLHDLLTVLPLSIFVLIVRMHFKYPALNGYLTDPIRRHLLLSDLPHPLRMELLHDKKAIKQLEHILLTLSALGLARLAPNPDPKRYPMANSLFFFIGRGGSLRDTSTSNRGYAAVTPPIEQYRQYHYSFDSPENIRLYWHHMRAVVQSTPLAFRLDIQEENAEVVASRQKKYSVGTFDRTNIMKEFSETTTTTFEPVPPNDGCAGVDTGLFIHLKRHWDINPRPTELVSWFLSEWRRSAEKARPTVEMRVERLQKTWNSYVKALMPPEGIWKRNFSTALNANYLPLKGHGTLSIDEKRIRTRNVRATHERKNSNSKGKSHKRSLDKIDRLSQERRIHMRSRFTAKERDMLILIRAVGFFLNPVYRFWLEPSVLRDIMHEYVPESQTKTVQSLMAAGVREMVRPNKIAYLQRIVRNLSTFQEMCALRLKLARQPLTDPAAKRRFFMDAFDMANRLLFMESKFVPPSSVPEGVFEKYMAQGKVKIAAEVQQSATFPSRSQKPNNPAQIRNCVAYNIIMSTLLSDEDLNGAHVEDMVEQLSACSLSGVLEQLRIDGLISKVRSQNEDGLLSSKNQASLSYYFRHFFNHRFHSELVQQTKAAADLLEQGVSLTEEDSPGVVASVLRFFYTDSNLDLVIPEGLLNVFTPLSADQMVNATKQLRYLESADLHLENMVIKPSDSVRWEKVPSLEEIIASVRRRVPVKCIGSTMFDDFLLNFSGDDFKTLQSVHAAIAKSKSVGSSLQEILDETKFETDRVLWCLKQLELAVQVIQVGVDCTRYVLPSQSDCWLVRGKMFGFVPAPWTNPTGDINCPTLRWMAEGVLFTLINRPGIPYTDLKAKFAYALQPRLLIELVEVLERCGCVHVLRATPILTRFSSPFTIENRYASDSFEYVVPTKDAIERFSRIFYSVKLSDSLISNRTEYV